MTSAVDVAIVGAGPAGAWAALKLARAGARVTIFDSSHPREKPCGGGLTGRAVEMIVHELGSLPVPAVAVCEARFERAMAAPSERADARRRDVTAVRLSDSGVSSDSSLVVASRAALDGALLDAATRAGAVHVAERVIDLTCERSVGTIRTRRAQHRVGIVLGADGANSLVRRRLGPAFSRRQISVGTGYFVRGVTSREVVIRWMSRPPGYLWSFPRPDHLAIGVCAQGDAVAGVAPLQRETAGWIHAANLAPGSVRLQPYSWPIPSFDEVDFAEMLLAGDRWMLVGDAAGLVDPLTREGIYYALLSGEMAAASITHGQRGFASSYRASLYDIVVPELRRAAALKRGFFGAGFSRLIVQALAESAAIRTVMVDLVGGRQPYIGLRRRLLATGQFGLALKLMLIRSGWEFGE